jgi:hypothetical protein
MFSIRVDVIREVLELSLRGTPTEALISDLTEQLDSALSNLPPSRSGNFRIRVRTHPNNPRVGQLAANICKEAQQRWSAKLASVTLDPPVSRKRSESPWDFVW